MPRYGGESMIVDMSGAGAGGAPGRHASDPQVTTPHGGGVTESTQGGSGVQPLRLSQDDRQIAQQVGPSRRRRRSRAAPEAGARDGGDGTLPPPGDARGEAPSGGDGAAGGGDDPAAAVRRDHEAAVAGLRVIIAELKAIAEGRLEPARTNAMLPQSLEVAERLQAECEHLIALLDQMMERGRGQEPGLGFQATARTTVIREETRRARKKWPARAWDTIWDELKIVLNRIWSMISHLLTVKEWTVNGQVGGGVLGLAQAGISVTFGK